jgi:hypothetical protein
MDSTGTASGSTDSTGEDFESPITILPMWPPRRGEKYDVFSEILPHEAYNLAAGTGCTQAAGVETTALPAFDNTYIVEPWARHLFVRGDTVWKILDKGHKVVQDAVFDKAKQSWPRIWLHLISDGPRMVGCGRRFKGEIETLVRLFTMPSACEGS